MLANHEARRSQGPVCGLQVLEAPASGTGAAKGWLSRGGGVCRLCPTNGRREGWRRFRVPWRREGRGEVCWVSFLGLKGGALLYCCYYLLTTILGVLFVCSVQLAKHEVLLRC
jgi:hypothetical protein